MTLSGPPKANFIPTPVLMKRFHTTGSVADKRSTRPRKSLTDKHYRFIDERMAEGGELTATKLLLRALPRTI